MTHKTAEQILAEPNGYSDFVKAMFNRSGDLSKDFAHAAIGLVTEVHELRRATDLVNQIEEAGDAFFYGEAMRQVIGDSLGYPVGPKLVAAELHMLMHTRLSSDEGRTNSLNDLLDHAKRWIGYGKRPENLIAVLAEAGAVVAFEIRDGLGGEFPDELILLTNVKKLLKRYNGMTFSQEAAVNRDLGAERAVLEDAAAA